MGDGNYTCYPYFSVINIVLTNVETIFSRYSTIRNQSDKLLELLELPSLMREALNAEDYDSALDIFTFVRNLSKRYSEIPIVQVWKPNIIYNLTVILTCLHSASH